MSFGSLAGGTERLARHAAALLGFSIPISVAFDNVLLGLIALLWLASGDFRGKLAEITSNPVAVAALALFGMLAAGLLYGTPYPGQGIQYLVKYIDLLFIGIFVTLFRDAHTRNIALRWFCTAMILSFVVAELAAANLLDDNRWLVRDPGHSFKHSITHGLLSAFAAFLFALMACRQPRWPQRLLFLVLALVDARGTGAGDVVYGDLQHLGDLPRARRHDHGGRG